MENVFNSKFFKIAFLLIAITGWSALKAQNTLQYKIYKPARDSIWFPVTHSINGTFDVIQNPYWFNQNNYDNKVKLLWKRVRSPNHNIKKDGGYKKFIEDEFFSSRVFPNIGLHFIGGSYDTLWLTEYFDFHGYSYPKFWAILFSYIGHFGNEALETSNENISSHDHIADLYIFDLAAALFSTYPAGMDYLVKDLGMKGWHFNPIYDLDGDNFFNAGLNYILRPKVTYLFDDQVKPFIYLGMQTLAGISYDWRIASTLSFAMGLSLTDPLKQKGRFVTAIFHESQNDLDASLFINGSEDFRWRLNLYDNILNKIPLLPASWSLGIMLGQAKGPSYAFGINLNLPFGLGGIKNSPPKY